MLRCYMIVKNPVAKYAAGFFLQPNLAADANKEGGQRRPQTITQGRTLNGSHRWLQQRHSRLDANKAVGDDADDAADEGGVDDVPLSPEDSTEYY